MAVLNDGRQSVRVTANKTFALADCGIVQDVATDALTMTLPASAAGLNFTVRSAGVTPPGAAVGTASDASMIITIATTGTDSVGGNGFTPAASKGAVNTKVTSRVGDEIKLIGGAAGTWVVEYVKGTWVRQA